jgi:hypothetical protein
MDYYQSSLFNSLGSLRILALIGMMAISQAMADETKPILETTQPEMTSNRVVLAPIVALAFPQPLLVGIEVSRLSSSLRGYLEAGPFRYPISSADRAVSLYSIESGFRWMPLSKILLLNLGVGYRRVGFQGNLSSLTVEGEVIATGAEISFSTFYVTPSIGIELSLSQNLKCAFDLGAQVPLLAWGKMGVENQNNGTNSENAQILEIDSSDPMRRIAMLAIPKVTLFRLIWSMN